MLNICTSYIYIANAEQGIQLFHEAKCCQWRVGFSEERIANIFLMHSIN